VSTRPTTVVVVHPESMAAEGIAAGLARYPGLVSVGTATTALGGRRLGELADAVVLHAGLMGASAFAHQLRRLGIRVILIGEKADDEEICVSAEGTIDDLASALVPGAAPSEARLPALTPRERQVLTLVAGGLAGKQVARHLGISPKTVERHKTRIYSKLGVPNQAAAAGFAARHHDTIGEVAWN
jgi:DNA-binding CsgD family transcriptional regulator